MRVTWRGALAYAAIVTAGSMAVGALVNLAWALGTGGLRGWADFWVRDPWNLGFLAGTTGALALTRRWSDPLPAWRVYVVDWGVYLAALLLWTGLHSWVSGGGVPVDDAFVIAAFAMFSLQLPAAWLLSAWRARHLETVLTPRGSC